MGAKISVDTAQEYEASARGRVQKARIAVVAAKYAYALQSDRWLSLWSQAVAGIEACPKPYREGLRSRLSSIVAKGE